MSCCGGFGYGGFGYGGFGFGGYGLGCCAPCIPPFFPKCVDGCPIVVTSCGAIYPDECGASLCNPCYGGISGPAAHCSKKKCCESSTNGCGLNYEKPKKQWFTPGTKVNACNCNC